jgi:hypothetical protein
MAGRGPPTFVSFMCPNCKRLYHVVKAKAGSDTTFHEVTCRACRLAQFPGRDGEFVVKYFMLRLGARRCQRRVRATPIRRNNAVRCKT